MWTLTKDLTPLSSEFQKSRNRMRLKKVPEEIMAKNFLNLTTGITLPSQESKQTLNMINPNKSTPGHIIIKLLKN